MRQLRWNDCLAALGLIGVGGGAPTELRPQSELQSNCFNFPEDNFSPSNCVKCEYGTSPYFPLRVGDRAIDFTLHDLTGQPWNLAEALSEGKPVVLIWGMFTCPAYQGLGTEPPFDKSSYWLESDTVELYKDRATFVHLYGAEPHPMIPDTNFDSGRLLPLYWSVIRQPLTYDGRLEMARRTLDLTHPNQVLLPDYLLGNPYSELVQPVWCTYAMGARTATIVGEDGRIEYQRDWLQTERLQQAIDAYWSKKQGDKKT
ncbi:unnamed protein product [Choristocarpus tenellus]